MHTVLYPLAAGRRGLPLRENWRQAALLTVVRSDESKTGLMGARAIMLGGENGGLHDHRAPCPSLARGARVRLLSGANGIRFDPIHSFGPPAMRSRLQLKTALLADVGALGLRGSRYYGPGP